MADNQNKIEIHEYKINELKETQGKILETQDEFDKRLKSLEENRIEMKMEFQNLKQSQVEQKALILDLDRANREKYEKLFGKILENQDVQFNKLIEAQDKREADNDEKMSKFVNKLIDSQDKKDGNSFELTKSKLAIILGIVSGVVTIVTMLIEKFAPIVTK